jgi:putative transposase
MPRLARVVACGLAHHVTQRGNSRQTVFGAAADCHVYLALLREYTLLHELSVLGYCLMPNHVHLIAIPRRPESLAATLRHTHGRYAAYRNAQYGSSGHVWQGRYYSCPLEGTHLWTALRYVELNPVRAGLVAAAEEYDWSSAAAHCSEKMQDWLEPDLWRREWTPLAWRDFLSSAGPATDVESARIRSSTHTGRPLGSTAFVRDLEAKLSRRLAARKGGRPRKPREGGVQAPLPL